MSHNRHDANVRHIFKAILALELFYPFQVLLLPLSLLSVQLIRTHAA